MAVTHFIFSLRDEGIVKEAMDVLRNHFGQDLAIPVSILIEYTPGDRIDIALEPRGSFEKTEEWKQLTDFFTRLNPTGVQIEDSRSTNSLTDPGMQKYWETLSHSKV